MYSFIKGIWGVYDSKKELGKIYSRRAKIDNDILLAKLNPYSPKTKVYVFGEENYKKMVDDNWDCTLIDKRPFVFDMEKEQYRHKIEIWKSGLEEFDEVVFTDWDCVPTQKIPDNFWEVMRVGEKIKASIYMYVRARVPERIGDTRKTSAATFVYLKGKETAEGIIEEWERLGRPFFEEIALSTYIDKINNGWKGVIDYMKFEPIYHTLFHSYPVDYVKNVMLKNNIFFHLNSANVLGIIGEGNVDKIKKRLNGYYDKEIDSILREIKIGENLS